MTAGPHWRPSGQLPVPWDEAAFQAHQLRLAGLAAAGPGSERLRTSDTLTRATLTEAAREFLTEAERRALGRPLEACGPAELAGALFGSEQMAGPHRLPTGGLPPLRTVLSPEQTMAAVARGEWTAEMGPILIPAQEKGALVGLGLRVPNWKCFADLALPGPTLLNLANLHTGTSRPLPGARGS